MKLLLAIEDGDDSDEENVDDARDDEDLDPHWLPG